MTRDEEKKIHGIDSLFDSALFHLVILPNTPLKDIRGSELLISDSDNDSVRILREQLYP